MERMLWSGEATIVSAQTTEGEIGIQPKHEPMLGQLVDNGTVAIRPIDGGLKVAAVQGGFISVNPDRVTILADHAVWADEVDSRAAEEGLNSAHELERSRAQAALKAQRRLAEG